MERIGQLVEVKNPETGRVFTRFQNYEAERTIRYDQQTWRFLPFLSKGPRGINQATTWSRHWALPLVN